MKARRLVDAMAAFGLACAGAALLLIRLDDTHPPYFWHIAINPTPCASSQPVAVRVIWY